MNTTYSDMTPPAWMAQLTDPKAWQTWMTQAQPNFGAASGTGGDLAVMLDPATLTQLQESYMEKMSALWQDMLGDKVPALTDRRFTGPAWKGNKLYSFNAAAYLLNAQFLMAMADAAKVSPKKKQKI